ncbi:hypothetical protein FE257_004860 [Aspergillus nanangensis]|uniref:Pyruvate decarboxylase n=1 Tax=Aspergillus nanangensis TaxID=2582783 RepID=A0AAD4CAM8_ASPNN|nr:hypothetical protein FE257_004860 [Aspergillus nanangensis]
MATVGSYLATRLAQVGIQRHFVVPGDYNLILLDQLQQDPGLDEINCTNELNCSMAAEGYARAKGIAACVVTYSVGAFSAFNGIGSAYGENLPVVLISGAPNTNDASDFNLLHHTIAEHDFDYQLEMAKKITVAAVAIRRASDAPRLIDDTLRKALFHKKPVYIEIPTNIANQPCAPPGPETAILHTRQSDAVILKESVNKAAGFLSTKGNISILVGPKARSAHDQAAIQVLAEALGCAVTVMPGAKSFFPETHPQYAGVYWGQASTLGADAIVDWSDIVICVGTVWTDYSTVGWTARPASAACLTIDKDQVQFAGADYSSISMADFTTQLAQVVKKSPATMVEYKRLGPYETSFKPSGPAETLTRKEMCHQIESLVTSKSALLVDTGDSWFNGMQMHLPEGARFEIEMQWGHIGWSVPASLGYAVGRPDHQVITTVGDGSFQVTAQEVSQLTRLRIPVIFFLINNGGYTIEVEIHDGIYNNIQNWDYAAFIETFNAGNGHGRGYRATTAGELSSAIESARMNLDGPSLIECVIDRDDCSKELISWGRSVGVANGRPPKRQKC